MATSGFDASNFQSTSFDGPPDLPADDGRDRVQLANELAKKGYHPILIFGTRASGKSSLLASLFHYLRSDPESPAIAVQGEWIVPIDTGYGRTVADAATQFLNHAVLAFYNGQAAPRTMDTHPYYIPIILRPNNGLPEIRLAFLESRGEWYHIKPESKDLFPALREEIADVYKNYRKSISILVIAPYVIGDAYSTSATPEQRDAEMKSSDTAIYGSLYAYQMHRQNRDDDHFLFKWDAHTKTIVNKDFSRPPRGLVASLIEQRYPQSWTLFRNMQSGEAQSMQYSAGIMSGDRRAEIPPQYRPLMNQFPQVLWKWLYSNASGGLSLFDGPPEQQEAAAPAGKKLLGLVKKIFT
jgi:hypothetical protein